MDFSIPIIDDTEIKKGNRRSGIMLAYPFEEKRLLRWKPPYIIQPKLDGVRCRAVISNGYVQLYSSEMRYLDHVPHIQESLSKMYPEGTIEIDGELYNHDMNFQEIVSITGRSKNIHSDYKQIQFHMFDIVSTKDQVSRISELNKHAYWIPDSNLHVVPSSLVRDFAEIMEHYNAYIKDGYEGFILRDAYASYCRKRSTGMMKFKPHQHDDYVIVGFEEEMSIDGVPKQTLGALVCTSSEGTLFNVGTGFTAAQREELWLDRENLRGKKVKVKYQALTSGKYIPRFPVFLEIVP